jgi:prepilin-type N-terminal cleavage/methylation domain-containing protein
MNAPALSFRRGVGLVELMISLAIVGLLLTAAALALDASFTAYAVNQEQASLMQQARVTVNRIVTSVRKAKAHSPVTPTLALDFSQGQTVSDSAIGMFDESGNNLVYSYDPAGKTVSLAINSVPYLLAHGVEAFSVKMEPMRSPESLRTGGSWDLLRRATVFMTIRTTDQTAATGETTRNQTITLSAAVAPRQNSW